MLCFSHQHEAKLNTLTLNLRDIESKKRILEEAVDTLNEEIAGLKAKGCIFSSPLIFWFLTLGFL